MYTFIIIYSSLSFLSTINFVVIIFFYNIEYNLKRLGAKITSVNRHFKIHFIVFTLIMFCVKVQDMALQPKLEPDLVGEYFTNYIS